MQKISSKGDSNLLETNRCLLLKLQQKDLQDIRKLYTNENVRQYLGGTWKDEDIQARFTRMLESSMDSLYWVVREKQSHKFIGLVSLDLHHDEVNREVSYQLLPEWWGAGYGVEVLQTILDYAFTVLNLPKVVAETQSANIASCLLLEKLGMEVIEKVIRFGEEQSIYSIKRY